MPTVQHLLTFRQAQENDVLSSKRDLKKTCSIASGASEPEDIHGYCIALGDPIMDIIALEKGSMLEDLGYERGGCVSVDDYDEISRLVSQSELKSRVPGGSAANVIKGIAGLSKHRWKCAFVGKVGEDSVGAEYTQRLADAGVLPCLARSNSGRRTAEAVSLVSQDGQRTMRPFLGAAQELSLEDLPRHLLSGARLLHIEGYALFRPAVARAAAMAAREAGALVSLDLASFELVRMLRDTLLDFLDLVDLVFCNEDEAATLMQEEEFIGSGSGCPDHVILKAVSFLSQRCKVVTISRGKWGCVTYEAPGSDIVKVPAGEVSVVDTTGAGDLFTSGFLSAYLEGESIESCGQRGCYMGSKVVQHLGAELPKSSWDEIHSMLPLFSTPQEDNLMSFNNV